MVDFQVEEGTTLKVAPSPLNIPTCVVPSICCFFSLHTLGAGATDRSKQWQATSIFPPGRCDHPPPPRLAPLHSLLFTFSHLPPHLRPNPASSRPLTARRRSCSAPGKAIHQPSNRCSIRRPSDRIGLLQTILPDWPDAPPRMHPHTIPPPNIPISATMCDLACSMQQHKHIGIPYLPSMLLMARSPPSMSKVGLRWLWYPAGSGHVVPHPSPDLDRVVSPRPLWLPSATELHRCGCRTGTWSSALLACIAPDSTASLRHRPHVLMDLIPSSNTSSSCL